MWITRKNKQGFTLIELLIAVAIIGILAAVATVSLTQARRRARDTKRISDIQQVRNALSVYSNRRATYPPGDSIVLGQGNAGCLDDSDIGFKNNCPVGNSVIMQPIPSDQNVSSPPYVYTKTISGYKIEFTLEGEIGDLPGGNCTAIPEKITCAP